MNISEIEKRIKDIETRSEEAHRGMFVPVSDKFILKDEVDAYKALLEDLEALRHYEAYVEQHRAVIEEYERRKNRVSYPGAYKVTEPAPVVEEQTADKVVEPVITPIEEVPVVEPKKEEIHIDVPVVDKVEEKQPEKVTPKKKKPSTKQKRRVTNRKRASERRQRAAIDLRNPNLVFEPIPGNEPEQKVDRVNPITGRPVIGMERIPEKEWIEVKKEEPELKAPEKIESPVNLAEGLDSTYGFKRGQIIQDLPIRDKSEQVFTNPGMTADEIAASQEKINSIPIADPAKIVDPIAAEIERRKAEYDAQKKASDTYIPMTPEQIAESQEKLKEAPEATAAKPMTPEEIEASKKKIAESDPKVEETPEKVEEPKKEEKKKGKKRKVTKRKKFDWKNNAIINGISKTALILKGIIFGEIMEGRSKDYINICEAIGHYRAAYKSRDIATNNNELRALDAKIAASTLLTIEEKKRLYVKLGKLAKQVERNNRIQQTKAQKEANKIVDSLNAEESLTR